MVETNPFAAARIAGGLGLAGIEFIYEGSPSAVDNSRNVFSKSWDVITAAPRNLENTDFSIKFLDQQRQIISIPNVIITQLSVQEAERVQISSGFAENVHINAFGREPKRVAIAGHVLYNKGFEGMQSLSRHYTDTWRAFQAAQKATGQQLIAITGPWANPDKTNVTIYGVALGLRYSISSAQNSILEFSMDFVEVSDTISPGDTKKQLEGVLE